MTPEQARKILETDEAIGRAINATEGPSAHPPPETQDGRGAFAGATGWVPLETHRAALIFARELAYELVSICRSEHSNIHREQVAALTEELTKLEAPNNSAQTAE